jgi:hypothetical protein
MKSILIKGSRVLFPTYTGERAYMVHINKHQSLPEKYSRWQGVIDSMLDGVETKDTIYMTIDQGHVKKGCSQRREGAHIDGNWLPDIRAHGTGGHVTMGWDSGGGWIKENLTNGGIIIASDCDGAKAYKGDFEGVCGKGGDCSHIDLTSAKTVILKPNTVYLGNVTMIHETMPAIKDIDRTFVRLTLPENYKFAA